MKMTTLRGINAHIAAGDFSAACAAIDAALIGETGRDWHKHLRKLQATLTDGVARFSIFAADGNGKLPFVAFSSLPGSEFCPGAGACLDFCYSYRAWRYPAAYARQAQNAALLQTAAGRTAIMQALDTLRPADGSALDFRLYVDGDFRSVADVRFWMFALLARPWLRAYGYSKSWRELLAYDQAWPRNYLLNLSSGSIHSDEIKAQISALPITRGEFVAVPVPHKVRAADHGNREHQAKLRAAYGAKAFTCPGKCGSCTPKGHACGSDRFRGVPVIIAVH